MKLIVSTAAALLLAGQAFAGALVFEAPVEEEIIVAEPAPDGRLQRCLAHPGDRSRRDRLRDLERRLLIVRRSPVPGERPVDAR